MAAHPYGADYRRRRAALLGLPCVWCGAPADTADHVPTLASCPPGEWTGVLLPACRRCNFGRRAETARRRRPAASAPQSRRRRVLV